MLTASFGYADEDGERKFRRERFTDSHDDWHSNSVGDLDSDADANALVYDYTYAHANTHVRNSDVDVHSTVPLGLERSYWHLRRCVCWKL